MAATRAHSLKDRQRQEREQLILRAAEELLLERGYHETSIDDIAAHVGVSKGTIYLHFASKEDLVLALMERGRQDLLRALDAIIDSPSSPKEKLTAIIQQMYAGMSRQRYQVMSAVFASPELHSRLFEKRSAFAAQWEEPMRRLANVLDAGKAHGEFDTSLPTPVMVTTLGALLSPHGYYRLVISGGMSLDEVVGHLSRFYLKGIAACPRVVGRQASGGDPDERDGQHVGQHGDADA